jgi:fused signal recognition particle receptor
MARLFKRKAEKKQGFWKRLKQIALTDVRVAVGGMDDEGLEALEERLLAADFGVQATLRLMDRVEEQARQGKARLQGGVQAVLRSELEAILEPARGSYLHAADEGLTVYLIVGVNGVGKTTSIAKLAYRLRQEGRSVLLAAADTYRAGAVEQLRLWADSVGAQFVGGQQRGDPAAVAFDAIDAAVARGIDVVLIDTAGRLHTHGHLMEELRKVDRVVRRRLEGAPHETLLVLDATVGQNALSQVDAFGQAVDLTGIVLAKLDSTARGGVIVALQEQYGLPVKLVGTGEAVDDIAPFDVEGFLDGIFAED